MRSFLSILVVFGIFLTACSKDFLETAPFGQPTSDQFWRNADDAVAAANALYEPLDDEDYFGHNEQTFDICSDDFWRAGDHGEDQAIEEFTFDASNDQLSFSYTRKYEIINRANAILLNVPNIDMDAALKSRILGEAHFMRAFAMWTQHVVYGALPIITETDYRDNNFNKPKPTVDEFRAFMEADWKEAARVLPASYDAANIGRPTSGAANGFLAKLYVHWEKFADAITAGQKVISGPYPLAANFADNFTIATENNPEMLFAVQSLEGWNVCEYEIYTTPRPWGGWDFHEPIQDLVDEFEPNDPRLNATVFKLGDIVDLGGSDGPTEYVAGLSQTNYHFRKFASWRPSGGLDENQNVPLLRAADVYLLVAEAKIRSNQNGDTEINAVRARAGLAAKSNCKMSDLIHERRVELAGEIQRHIDLMRWDKAGIIDLVAHYAKDRGQFKPARTFQRPKHYFFAIPQAQIDLSNGVLTQNSGY